MPISQTSCLPPLKSSQQRQGSRQRACALLHRMRARKKTTPRNLFQKTPRKMTIKSRSNALYFTVIFNKYSNVAASDLLTACSCLSGFGIQSRFKTKKSKNWAKLISYGQFCFLIFTECRSLVSIATTCTLQPLCASQQHAICRLCV